MTLNRFLVLSLFIFSLGIVILYNGLNRVPLRQIDPNATHKHGHSSLLQSEAVANKTTTASATALRLKNIDIIQKRS